MGRIIGLLGLIGSGKDTVSDILVNSYGFTQMSFGTSLKEAVSSIFGWPIEQLEGKTKESRLWREQVDTWWAARLNMPELTPRWILQHWGTNINRNMFHQDIWAASIERKLIDTKQDIVISDCRFNNEIEILRKLNAVLCKVERGAKPPWYDTAVDVLNNVGTCTSVNRMSLNYPDVHISEWGWVTQKVDYVILNNSSLSDLHLNIDNIVRTV